MTKCTICGNPIPELRLELAPNTVTCSKACSRQHTRNISAKSSRKHRARKSAMRDSPKT